MGIQQEMEKMYKSRHNGPAPLTELIGKDVKSKQKPDKFRIFMAEKRQEYIKKNKIVKKNKKINKDRKCPLCHPTYALIYAEHLAIRTDPHPMYNYHMQIVPLKEGIDVSDFELFENNYRLGNVTKDHLDCREYPTKKDIDLEVKLVQTTDYMIMQSMNGSGASVPSHIHSHAFKKKLMRFPLIEERKFSEFYKNNKMTLMKIENPSYGFMINGNNDNYGAIIHKFFNKFHLPFNLLITEAYGDIVALFFPRVKEIPNEPIYDTWQFGVIEMLGLFEAKNKEQFTKLTYNQLYQGIKDTTVHDRNTQNQMEESMIQIVGEIGFKNKMKNKAR